MYIGILEYNHDIISYMCILYHCMFVVGHDLVEPQARKAGYGTSACETKIVLSGIFTTSMGRRGIARRCLCYMPATADLANIHTAAGCAKQARRAKQWQWEIREQ